MVDTKTITHALITNPGGRYAISGDDVVVNGPLSAGSETVRIETTIKMTYDKVITVAQGAATPVNQLRYISALNKGGGAVATLASTHSEIAQTIQHTIGSDAVRSVTALLINFAISAVGTSNAIIAPGNGIAGVSVWLENAGTLTQLSFGGSTSRSLADAEFDALSTGLLAALPRGASVLFHVKLTFASGGMKVPVWSQDQSRYSSANVARSYDPAVTTATLGVGGWSFTGTSPTQMARMPAVVHMVGLYASGDPVVALGDADSMFDGNFDVANSTFVGPRGMFHRMLVGSGGSDAISGMNIGISGARPDHWFASSNVPAIRSLGKYANAVVCGYHGLNNFGAGANVYPSGETSNRNQWLAMWSEFRGFSSSEPGTRPLKILQVGQTSRLQAGSVTGATPNQVAIDVASQVPYGPMWDLGGDARKHMAWIETMIGQPTGPDALSSLDAILRPTTDPTVADFYKFKAGTNTDIVHLGPVPAAACAAKLRSDLLAMMG